MKTISVCAPRPRGNIIVYTLLFVNVDISKNFKFYLLRREMNVHYAFGRLDDPSEAYF